MEVEEVRRVLQAATSAASLTAHLDKAAFSAFLCFFGPFLDFVLSTSRFTSSFTFTLSSGYGTGTSTETLSCSS